VSAHANISPEVMTVDEVAQYLRVSRSTVYRLLRDGEVPASKVGGYWRFRRHVIDTWLSTNEAATFSSHPSQ
jgi:excisionase family DNA binding protein